MACFSSVFFLFEIRMGGLGRGRGREAFLLLRLAFVRVYEIQRPLEEK